MNQALQYIAWIFGQWVNFLFNSAAWTDSNVGGVSIGWILVAGIMMVVIIKTVVFIPKGEIRKLPKGGGKDE